VSCHGSSIGLGEHHCTVKSEIERSKVLGHTFVSNIGVGLDKYLYSSRTYGPNTVLTVVPLAR